VAPIASCLDPLHGGHVRAKITLSPKDMGHFAPRLQASYKKLPTFGGINVVRATGQRVNQGKLTYFCHIFLLFKNLGVFAAQ
jgi:hypothetical protein